MKASVVIVNWRKPEETLQAIGSCLAQAYADTEIIVVDNGSNDGSLELIRDRFPNIKTIGLPQNIGCPGGRNIGAAVAAGDVIFFLDDDGSFKENDLVGASIEYLKSQPTVGAIYFKIWEPASQRNVCSIDAPNDNSDLVTLSSSFRGGAAAIRRDVFFALGGYPTEFFRQAEEIFLGYLIYDIGYSIAYWPKKTMIHRGSTYAGKTRDVLRYQYRNELKTIIGLFPFRMMMFALIRKMLGAAFRFFQRGLVLLYLAETMALFSYFSDRGRRRIVKAETLRKVTKLKRLRSDAKNAHKSTGA